MKAENLLERIASSALSNLQMLILHLTGRCPDFQNVSQMPYIRHLSLTGLKSTTALAQLFRIMTNIAELNLSMYSLCDLKDLHLIEIPKTPQKLHLELGRYYSCGFFN
jgi:hypothetical protein